MNTKTYGIQGEAIAKEYLTSKGYKVLETNYVNKIGEIDLIAQLNDIVIFVEVKARNSLRFGLPREAVTRYKQNKIRSIAKSFLKQHKLLNQKVRFDVIDILCDKVTHIENAF